MPRKKVTQEKPTPGYELVHWFVTEFLGEKWDYRHVGLHFAQAKRLINPDPDPVTGQSVKAYDPALVRRCLEMMRDGYWEKLRSPIRVLSACCWGTPPFIERLPPPVPSVHEHISYDDWVMEWGQIAIKAGRWDGIYHGWDGHLRTPQGPFGLHMDELRPIVGDERLFQSLLEFADLLH